MLTIEIKNMLDIDNKQLNVYILKLNLVDRIDSKAFPGWIHKLTLFPPKNCNADNHPP